MRLYQKVRLFDDRTYRFDTIPALDGRTAEKRNISIAYWAR